VDWHRRQLQDVRRAGINVIVPRFRGDVFAKQRYSQRGLQTLVAALQSMDRYGQDYPQVALYLEAEALSDSKGDKLDLTTESGKSGLFAAIKDFYLQIPAAYRASVQLNRQNGGRLANVAILSSAAGFAAADESLLGYCRSRFFREFGRDLALLGGSDFKGKCSLDGYVDDSGSRGFKMAEGGWIKCASVGPGYDHTLQGVKENPLRSRADGKTYAAEWKQAIAGRADWVFIDGWNDFAENAEIAPTLQNGIQYLDMTRLYAQQFDGVAPFSAVPLNHTVPTSAAPSSRIAASVRILNSGMSVWTPETVVLTSQWIGPDGSRTGSVSTIPLTIPIVPGQAATVPLNVVAPSAPGEYSLRVEPAQIRKKDEAPAPFGPTGDALVAGVRIGPAAAGGTASATVISQDTPVTAESGGTYPVNVTLRNDGPAAWKKQGGRITARVWRYTSPINSTAEPEQIEVLDMADAGADLPADVAPGEQVTVSAKITFSSADRIPLPSWSQADNWIYQLRWEYSADDQGTNGAVSDAAPLALVDADLGAQFISDLTPQQLPGDRRVPVKIGVRNLGPQTWLKDKVRIGYHWYYLDGTEAVWQDETTPLAQDVEPGGQIPEMLAWITAPPYDGDYYLVWDLKVGDSWGSTLPSARPNETKVLPIQVVHGKLTLVDLSKSYNLDGVTFATGTGDGDFDGAGRTFPAELIPPFAMTDSAPATLWLPAKGTGLDSSRKISFRWGPKGDKDKNFIQCLGQRVPLTDPKKADSVSRIHLLAATTGTDKLGEFTLVFTDGSQQLNTFLVSKWDSPPTHGEEMAAFCRYSHSRSGPATDKPVSLNHYIVRVRDNKKKIAAILLPNAPEIKIAAITLEK
jgi:hypothetical protein